MKPDNRHITALIDGEPVRVRKGLTVLDAARQAGIYIPTLCYLENLKSYGGCRLCIVEIKGSKGYPTACTTPLEPGMEIKTRTPEIQSLRRNVLEMTLSEHPYTCLVCRDKKECGEFMHTTRKAGTITGCNFCTSNGDCELQDLIDYLDLKDVRYPIAYRGIPPDKDNPFYDLDYNLCILCGRCVRICNEERNSNVLAFVQRGNSTIVGTAFNETQAEAGCEFCGACVDVCPTGSISEKMGKWAGLPDRSTPTTCTLCSVGCTMNVNTRGSRVVNVGPKPGRRISPPQLCLRGKFLAGDIVHHPDRVTAPMIRKKDKWIEVSMEEAIRFAAGKLEKYRGNGFGLIGSAQDTLEENYSLQKFSRQVMHSNNIDLFGSYPDREAVMKIHELISSTAPGSEPDIHKADTILILGSDASVSHPLLENSLRKACNNGRNILYAHTQPTRTSQFASHEVHYRPGTEYDFLYLLIASMVKDHPSGLHAGIAGQFKNADASKAAGNCGVGQDQLKPFAGALAASRNLWILAGDDALRSGMGKKVLEALGNLKYLVDRDAKCCIRILGYEGNLYGGALAGAHPDLMPGLGPVSDEKTIQKWNRFWGSGLSQDRGLTCHEMLDDAAKNGISALMIAGDFPLHRQIRKAKFVIQMNMFRTALTECADVFLPVPGFLENEGHFMALDGKIKTLKRTVRAPGQSRTIPYILSELASAMDQAGSWDPAAGAIWKEIRSHTKLHPSKAAGGQKKFLPMNLQAGKRKDDLKSPAKIRYNHFRYRGNDLPVLVPDLQAVLDELKPASIKKA